ncbi:MAG: hypothetical protein PQJ61_11295 [Spirochaetales bacterium]|uniref:DUF4381 domain-containing protein n=1 Tax=Candidatus Thalassospirochaeta sargassi TaxID=3119039 RepID=A0AAJ1IHT9_9SPIO|nr:hypothetical protein [Spirochaetales bacterium]
MIQQQVETVLRSFILTGILLFSLLGCDASEDLTVSSDVITDTYSRNGYSLEISYPGRDIEFGSRINITIGISRPAGKDYILLPPETGSAEQYANTVITGVEQSGPIIDSDGRAVDTYSFSVESWLPGELIFPPVSLSFGEELSSKEIVFQVLSAFDEEEEASLEPIWQPKPRSRIPVWIVIAAVFVILAAVSAVLILIRRRRNRAASAEHEPGAAELIELFRTQYIDYAGEIDQRAAFGAFERLPNAFVPSQLREIVDAARFSSAGVSPAEGKRILNELFEAYLAAAVEPVGEAEDDF